MMDPPREESKAAVAECIKAGIKPIMITGDHKVTATAIAKQIGIFKEGDLAMTGQEVDALTAEELMSIIREAGIATVGLGVLQVDFLMCHIQVAAYYDSLCLAGTICL